MARRDMLVDREEPTTRRAPVRLAALMLALILLLAACGGSRRARPGPSLPTAPSAATGTIADPLEAAYLDVMRGYFPGMTDGQLLAIGRGVCREFAGGVTRRRIVAVLVRGGVDAKTAAVTVTASVLAFCPTHRSAASGG